MASPFLTRVEQARKEKRSYLCVGLDPALPRQRTSQTIGKRYLDGADENEARLRFCLDILDMTQDYACAFKPNQQYLIGWTKKEHQILTAAIRETGAVSIIDYKLGEIADSAESALFHIRECGYDALTFNPFFGNLETAVKQARGKEPWLGLLVLTLTSNPEAIRFQKNATVSGKPLFMAIAEDVRRYDAEGAVVGATSHVSDEDIKRIREAIGPERIVFIPGIGTQKGELQVAGTAGQNVLVNVSRDIAYSEDPRRKADRYCARIRSIILGAG
jgi:orotidine 5'-phosphate decarboxylase subfamily 2